MFCFLKCGKEVNLTEIVVSSEPITLVGAGRAFESDLETCLKVAPGLVAADGGALVCLAQGHMPQVVIGDMDSLSASGMAAIPQERIHHIAEQDSTDFDKSLRHISAPVIVGVGFTGARLDHQLACFNALVRHADRRCVLLGETDIAFLAPPNIALPLTAGTRVSLFPMGLVEGVSEGLKWPIGGLVFTPDGQIGTSNIATGPLEIEMTSPKMIVIMPRVCLEMVVRALETQPAQWPALSK